MTLVLAAASVMAGLAGLGQWQLDRARENGDEQQQKKKQKQKQQEQEQEQARSVTALDGGLRARQTFPGRGSTSRSPPPGPGTPPTSFGRRSPGHHLVALAGLGLLVVLVVTGGTAYDAWTIRRPAEDWEIAWGRFDADPDR